MDKNARQTQSKEISPGSENGRLKCYCVLAMGGTIHQVTLGTLENLLRRTLYMAVENSAFLPPPLSIPPPPSPLTLAAMQANAIGRWMGRSVQRNCIRLMTNNCSRRRGREDRRTEEGREGDREGVDRTRRRRRRGGEGGGVKSEREGEAIGRSSAAANPMGRRQREGVRSSCSFVALLPAKSLKGKFQTRKVHCALVEGERGGNWREQKPSRDDSRWAAGKTGRRRGWITRDNISLPLCRRPRVDVYDRLLGLRRSVENSV